MTEGIDVLCAGIIVADHVCTPISHVPAAGELVLADGMLLTIGGCAANAAVDLAKMNVRAAVVGRVGEDIFGRIVADMLDEAGVDVFHVKVSRKYDTSQTLIVNVKGEDRRFVHTFGANAEFSAADIPVNLFGDQGSPLAPRADREGRDPIQHDQKKAEKGVTAASAAVDSRSESTTLGGPRSESTTLIQPRVLYLGGYLAMPGLKPEELAQVFATARRQGVKTVLDVVVPGPGDYRPHLDKLLPHIDVFLPNNQEAEIITGRKDAFDQAAFFRDLGAKTVVITMGGEGSVLVQDGVKLRAGAFSVPYVDGSGGGDAFDAGYIIGLLENLDAPGCLRYAAALGASCVRAIGTTPGVFTRAECEEFMGKNELRIEEVR